MVLIVQSSPTPDSVHFNRVYFGIGDVLHMMKFSVGRVLTLWLSLAGLLLLASCGAEAPTFEPGNIIVTSTPPGAAIIINDIDTGRTTRDSLFAPQDTLKRDPDIYRISVVLADFVPDADEKLIDLGPLETHEVHFSLSQTGFRIESPVGARILVGGEDTGKIVPAAVAGLEQGTVMVSLELDGYLVTPEQYKVTIVDKEIIDIPADAFTTRSRKTVILEGFANTSCGPCPELTDNLVAMVAKPAFTSDRVLYMEFSVSWPQFTDPFYQANPVENDRRINIYQVAGAPDLYIDGVRQVDALNAITMENSVLAALESDPGFLVDVTADLSSTSVPVTVTLTALRDLDLTGHVLFVAIYEKEIVIDPAPGINGQTVFHHVFRNVFRDLDNNLPALNALTVGVPRQFDVMLNRGTSAPDNYVVLAFVQHETSHAVLQAGSTAAPVPSSGRNHR